MKSPTLFLFLAWAASLQAAEPLPREASLIPFLEKDQLIARSQGARDDCSLFAITGAAELETYRHTPGPHERLSPEYLVWAGRKVSRENDDQAMFYIALEGLNRFGLCPEARMPYVGKSDPSRKPSAEAAAEARELRERWHAHWIKRWSLDCPLDERQLTEIKKALAGGHAVACGMRWPKSTKESQFLDVPKADEVSDGHSVLLVGYQDDPAVSGGGLLRFRNSWGPGWGENGYGAISYGYVEAYANDAVWLTIGAPDSEAATIRYEAETMAVGAHKQCSASPQKMTDFGAQMWSGGAQLFCAAEKGGFVELDFEVRAPGRYRLRALATAAPDFGKVRAALDGKALPPEFDLYSGRICPAGSLELGAHDFSAGRHRLRFTAVAKNDVSKGFNFGLDTVDLTTPPPESH